MPVAPSTRRSSTLTGLPRAVTALLAALHLSLLASGTAASDYTELAELFADWREFEAPPMLDGAPDYTAATFARRYEELATYRARLAAIDTSDWPMAQRVDWHVVRAEMNGFEFNHKVLKPWVRDPAYYQSIWTYAQRRAGPRGPDAPRRPRAVDL
jgi:hypothetical protein